MTDPRRETVARRLFREWTKVTRDPELLTTVWNNLSVEDRDVWLRRADEYLKSAGGG